MGIKAGFIGTGNMGSALLKGVIRSGVLEPSNIYIFDVDFSKSDALAKETGVKISKNNKELVKLCDYIILAVKPIYIKQVLEDIKDTFTNGKVLVSIAAGVASKTIKSVLGENRKVVRAMPNLPALVGEGMTLVCFDNNLSDSERAFVKRLFEVAGRVDELEERLMCEVTALTGSSPAYVFMLIEAMADSAVLQGIPRKAAYTMASQAVFGSAKMVLETGVHPAQLKDQVCSPAGTTIEAVQSLEKNGFRYAIMEAMNECTRRAKEISKESDGR